MITDHLSPLHERLEGVSWARLSAYPEQQERACATASRFKHGPDPWDDDEFGGPWDGSWVQSGR
jgi:hypothetical protein